MHLPLPEPSDATQPLRSLVKLMLPIFDTHQHLWDRTVLDLDWTADAGPLDDDFVMSDYMEATAGLNIVTTVYMEVDAGPGQALKEVDYVLDLCRDSANPMQAAVIGGNPSADAFEEYVHSFVGEDRVRGVRQVLHGAEFPRGTCLEPAFVSGVRLLGELNLSFDICIRPKELADALALVKECPQTVFILDHCGNADPNVVNGSKRSEPGTMYEHGAEQWRRDMGDLAERDNVVCKISGIIAQVSDPWTPEDLAPTIDYCLEAFGADRVMYGGDWPVCTLGAPLEAWMQAVLAVTSGRGEEVQRKLLHDNATRIYDLT